MSRLQTGMRGAYGKAHGTAARVRIGQILLSVRSHDKFKVSFLVSFYPYVDEEELQRQLKLVGQNAGLKLYLLTELSH